MSTVYSSKLGATASFVYSKKWVNRSPSCVNQTYSLWVLIIYQLNSPQVLCIPISPLEQEPCPLGKEMDSLIFQKWCQLSCNVKFSWTTPSTALRLKTFWMIHACLHWHKSRFRTKKNKTKSRIISKMRLKRWWPSCSIKIRVMRKSQGFLKSCSPKSTLKTTITSCRTKNNWLRTMLWRYATKSSSSIYARTQTNPALIPRWITF